MTHFVFAYSQYLKNDIIINLKIFYYNRSGDKFIFTFKQI